MQQTPEQLVDELIAAEPSLAPDRRRLISLVPQLLAAKPGAEINAEFYTRLRAKLTEPEPPKTQALHFLFGRVPAWLVVASLLAGTAVGAGGYATSQHLVSTRSKPTPSIITIAQSEAFGRITLSDTGASGSTAATPQSAVTDSATSSMLAPAPEMSSDSAKLLYQRNRIILPSTLPSLPTTDWVYQLKANINLAQAFSRSNTSLLQLGSSDLETVSLRRGDYSTNINLQTGEISMYQLYGVTPPGEIMPMIGGDVVAPSNRPAPARMSSDEIITTARAFLADMGIDASDYQDPLVVEPTTYNTLDAQMLESSPVYSSDIRFPLTIDGMPIVTTWGDPVGITVSVSMETRQVSSLSGYLSPQLERSQYSLTTNVTSLQKKLDLSLGLGAANDVSGLVTDTPAQSIERALVLTNQMNTDGSQKTLLVPGLLITASGTISRTTVLLVEQ